MTTSRTSWCGTILAGNLGWVMWLCCECSVAKAKDTRDRQDGKRSSGRRAGLGDGHCNSEVAWPRAPASPTEAHCACGGPQNLLTFSTRVYLYLLPCFSVLHVKEVSRHGFCFSSHVFSNLWRFSSLEAVLGIRTYSIPTQLFEVGTSLSLI